MKFVYNDGGREAAGYKGVARDCVCRAIAIATEMPYQEVYEKINQVALKERRSKKRKSKSSARDGVYKNTYKKLLENLGWKWVACMQIGTGCKVHLRDGELPNDKTMIVQVSKHLTVVRNGEIHDTYNPSRDGNRCVYGYFSKS